MRRPTLENVQKFCDEITPHVEAMTDMSLVNSIAVWMIYCGFDWLDCCQLLGQTEASLMESLLELDECQLNVIQRREDVGAGTICHD